MNLLAELDALNDEQKLSGVLKIVTHLAEDLESLNEYCKELTLELSQIQDRLDIHDRDIQTLENEKDGY
jgi:hypothetical protein